jgi:hypothetical protein
MKAFPASWVMFVFMPIPLAAQVPARLPRTADGNPDLNGIWQALNTAAWDLEDHSGALHTPPGQGVAEGGEIPYQPEAIKKKSEKFAGREKYDLAETACYMPGVPRAMYMPYPFEIIQTPKLIEMNFTFAHARRNIIADGTPHHPHTWIYVDTKNADGSVTTWRFEMGPPNALLRMGWRKDSVTPGTQVEITGYRAKDGNAVANAKTVKLPDGRELFSGGSAPGSGGESSGAAEKKQ